MTRVHVLVEGQTEETFVKNVLLPHFAHLQIYLYPRLIGKPGHRGGIGEYQRARGDILATLKQEADLVAQAPVHRTMPYHKAQEPLQRQHRFGHGLRCTRSGHDPQ